MKKFDVIVVGAGTGGCLAAKIVADAGLDVCLVDRKKKEEIGEKVCGDAIGKHHFDDLGIDYPAGEELERRMMGVRIHSPDRKNVFEVKDQSLYGFIINRRLFGQRLLKDAIDAGATLLESSLALEPTIENNFVTGISAKNLKTEEKLELSSQIVVDASGYSAALRKKLPSEIGVQTAINIKDVCVVYREIRELREQVSEPNFCEIYLSQEWAPGGYSWFFAESGKNVNVGLGVAMSGDFPKPKDQFHKNFLSLPLFDGSSLIDAGTWYDPTRRPLDCMTGNGVVIVGDAACQVNPIHGGGMGPSMRGGADAGETILEAIERGDVGRDALWPYNIKYMHSYGAKQAGLDVFRLLLQRLGDAGLNYVMEHRLITEEDLLKASMGGDARLNITEKTIRLFRGLRKLSFLKRLRDAAALLKRVRQHYEEYPASAQSFEPWRRKAQSMIEEAERWQKLR
ncbi:MAG: NAD(P)/FAD-dependent oxidoreductase [Candidatus Bathyarchaeota archaeon]|nr:MAG: NAD(P)/FAD-dependent oxidoreductase [Candidatus Bathyarchaeota archaeon]